MGRVDMGPGWHPIDPPRNLEGGIHYRQMSALRDIVIMHRLSVCLIREDVRALEGRPARGLPAAGGRRLASAGGSRRAAAGGGSRTAAGGGRLSASASDSLLKGPERLKLDIEEHFVYADDRLVDIDFHGRRVVCVRIVREVIDLLICGPLRVGLPNEGRGSASPKCSRLCLSTCSLSSRSRLRGRPARRPLSRSQCGRGGLPRPRRPRYGRFHPARNGRKRLP